MKTTPAQQTSCAWRPPQRLKHWATGRRCARPGGCAPLLPPPLRQPALLRPQPPAWKPAVPAPPLPASPIYVKAISHPATLQAAASSAAFWADPTHLGSMAGLYLRLAELAHLPPLGEPLDPGVHTQVGRANFLCLCASVVCAGGAGGAACNRVAIGTTSTNPAEPQDGVACYACCACCAD